MLKGIVQQNGPLNAEPGPEFSHVMYTYILGVAPSQ